MAEGVVRKLRRQDSFVWSNRVQKSACVHTQKRARLEERDRKRHGQQRLALDQVAAKLGNELPDDAAMQEEGGRQTWGKSQRKADKRQADRERHPKRTRAAAPPARRP